MSKKDNKKNSQVRRMDGNIIRDIIINMMKARGITKRELSGSVKTVMSYQLLCAYLRGQHDIGTRRASFILKALGLIVVKKNENEADINKAKSD